MPTVSVEIVELLSDDQPGFVAARLVDAYGEVHTFHDKCPVFGCDQLSWDSPLPVPGWLGCEIVEQFTADGHRLVRITTERPWDIDSTSGLYQFVVASDSILDDGLDLPQ